jgi:pimeloyl-ACP methyl ester carboxylesterase
MIDRLLCAKAKDSFDDKYLPEHAIAGSELLNSDSNKLAVVFPPWHGGGRFIQRLVYRLRSENWAVLNYAFHDQILEPSIQRVPQSFTAIKDQVADELNTLRKAQYERMHLIGISLGTMSMTLAASEYHEFQSATFVLPSSKLASSVWEGMRTQNIRQLLNVHGYTKSDVEEAWSELEPIKYAKDFTGKEVNTYVSSTDRIILPSFQREMVNALRERGSNLKENYSRLGHASSIINYCIRGNI